VKRSRWSDKAPQPDRGVTRCLRVDVNEYPVRSIELMLMPCALLRLWVKRPAGNEQNQRECGLLGLGVSLPGVRLLLALAFPSQRAPLTPRRLPP